MLKRIIFISTIIFLVPILAYADQRAWNSQEICEVAAKAIKPKSILISFCSLCKDENVEIWLVKSTDVEKVTYRTENIRSERLKNLYKVKILGKRLYRSKKTFTNSYSEPVEYESIKSPEDTLETYDDGLAYVYIRTGERSFGNLCQQLQLKCAVNVETITITPHMLDLIENRIKDEIGTPLHLSDSSTISEEQYFKTSFNCGNAITKIEKTICGVRKLADMDLEMGAIYRSLISAMPETEKILLKRDQLDWLQTRNKSCEDSVAVIDCMQDSYIKRIEILKNKKPPTTQQPDTLSGRYERETENESAYLIIELLPNNRVHVTGTSFFGTKREYGPNIGELDFEADVKDGQVAFSDHRSVDRVYTLELKFNKNHLTAKEEGLSDMFGMGVSFQGEYVKK
jgi:uncharacterized protein